MTDLLFLHLNSITELIGLGGLHESKIVQNTWVSNIIVQRSPPIVELKGMTIFVYYSRSLQQKKYYSVKVL